MPDNLTLTGLAKGDSMKKAAKSVSALVRAAGIARHGEKAGYDGWRGSLILSADANDRGGRVIATEPSGHHGMGRTVVDAKGLAHSLAANALRLECLRELRRIGHDRESIAPAWATTVDFDIALAAKLEGRHPLELHAALTARWNLTEEKPYGHLHGKWHAGRRNATHVERRGSDCGLPVWPGMSGVVKSGWDVEGSHVALEMLDLDGGAYLSARSSYWKVSLPRELSDEEVAGLGDGIGIRAHVAHPWAHGRRLIIASVARSKKRTNLTLDMQAHRRAPRGPGDRLTSIHSKVRVSRPTEEIMERARATARAILEAGGCDEKEIAFLPFENAMDFEDVGADTMPDAAQAAARVVGDSALARRIKTSFLKRMAEGETDPWEGVARDVAALMREAGVFMGPALMELGSGEETA